MLGAGRLIDKLGIKIGYALATGIWSLAAVGHALAKGVFGFSVARAVLGVSEAGNFPAAIKTVAEWFPKKERAFATGIFNSGSNIGAIVAPLSVPFIAKEWGWQWAFIITGMLGFIWLILWFIICEVPGKHKKLSKGELEYIRSDKDEIQGAENEPKLSWGKLLTYKQTWAFAIGKLLTDPIWWFYLFWLPDFLQSAPYNLKGTEIALPVALVYTMSTVGSIGGGWLPMNLMKNNWPVFKARKTSMLIYAFCVIPIVFAQILGTQNMWLAVVVIGIAAAAHQAWSANIYLRLYPICFLKFYGFCNRYWRDVWCRWRHCLIIVCTEKFICALQVYRQNRNGLLYHVHNLRQRLPAGLVDHALPGPEDEKSGIA
jgi:ACS family hexuronate transporter-like MFS transporter